MVMDELTGSVGGCAFKVNLSFGYVLFNKHTQEYRYYYSSEGNNALFDRAFTIARARDVDDLMRRILDLDWSIITTCRDQIVVGSWPDSQMSSW